MSLHEYPTAAQLVDAVEQFLRNDVMPAVEGRLQFHTLVAANVLAVVGRELTLGPAQDAAHADRLAGLGVADDAELAAAIRSGEFDGRLPELLETLLADVTAKVTVANPKHLQ
jgi:hypothetical protein